MYHSEVAKRHALVAQLDRVSDYESEGLGFESLRAHQKTLESLDSKVFSFPESRCATGNYHLFITIDRFGFDDT